MHDETASVLEQWHKIINDRDASLIANLLDDDVVFHSPVVHHPINGKQNTFFYLAAAIKVFGNEHFKYVRQVVQDVDIVLEFETEIDDIKINGIDMIRCRDGKIIDFKVMIRPLKAIEKIHAMMAAMLQKT